jgi:hypothetical protein
LTNKANPSFRGDAIRASLFANCITGAEGKQIIVISLESKGMFLDSTHFYSLSELEMHFKNLFGEFLAAKIFEHVKSDLMHREK